MPSRALRTIPILLATALLPFQVMCESTHKPPTAPKPAAPIDPYAALPPAQPHRTYTIPRAKGPVVIDGDINKPVWRDAPWTEEFVDIEGDLKPRPPLRTRVKMMWDDENLYFVAQMQEPHVWATLTERDSVIFHDNDFEVFLYPGFDAKRPGAPVRNYYELEINALNTVWDLCLPKPYREGGQADNSWTIEGLQTAVKVRGTLNNPSDTDEGWDVEVAMPLRAFNRHARPGGRSVVPREGEQWKLNFSRVEWDLSILTAIAGCPPILGYEKIPNRPEHNWVWSPMGLIDMHVPQRWGVVEFGK